MTAEKNDIGQLLRMLNGRLSGIEEQLSRMEDQNAAIPRPRVGVAIVDIDDPQWGNPPVWRDPLEWWRAKKPSLKGKKYSECPPEYLDGLAKFNDYMAVKWETEGKRDRNGKPIAWRARADAEKARLWAARIRSQQGAPPPSPSQQNLPAQANPDKGYPDVFDDEPADDDGDGKLF